MHYMSMGSGDVINQRKAAEILEVTPQMVAYMTRKGELRQKMVDGQNFGGQVFYDVEEVSALKEARERGQTITDVAETAAQAFAAARVSQRKLEVLESILGLKTPSIPLNTESVQALHLEAEEDLKLVINGAEKVNYWANKFFAMCEEYLEWATKVTGDENAWEVYLRLSQRLLENEDFQSAAFDPMENMAYRRLQASRKQLRQAIFTYMLQKYGKQQAFKVFPSEFRGPHYDIMLYATE